MSELAQYQPLHQELDEVIEYLRRLLDALDNSEPLPEPNSDMPSGPRLPRRRPRGPAGKTIMVPGSGSMIPIDNYNPIQQGHYGSPNGQSDSGGFNLPGDSGFTLPPDNSGGGGGGGF